MNLLILNFWKKYGSSNELIDKKSGNGQAFYIIHGARRSWIGEDGPEVIIPLGEKRRARGMSLWKQAGELLGYHSLLGYGSSAETTSENSIFDGSEKLGWQYIRGLLFSGRKAIHSSGSGSRISSPGYQYQRNPKRQ